MNAKAPTQPPTTAELAAIGGVKPSAPPPPPKYGQPTQFRPTNRESQMTCVTESLRDRVVAYTDAGTWKASFYWKETSDGSITLEGAKQMLIDLDCDKCEGEEILTAVQHIRERYKLADELREIIRLSNSGQIGNL